MARPTIPSAAEVKAQGVDLGEISRRLLQKVEELTLYLLEQERGSPPERIQELETALTKHEKP